MITKSKMSHLALPHKTTLMFLVLLIISQQLSAESWLFAGSQVKSKVDFYVNGQPIDSLFKQMQSIVYNHPDEARRQTIEAINKAHDLKQYDWEIRLYNLVGSAHAIKSEYDQALVFYHKALELALEVKTMTRLADTYNNLGAIQYYARNYPEALANYLEALNYYEKDEVYDKIAGVHCNIGYLYLALKNYEKSKNHFAEALIGFKKLKIIPGQTISMLGMSQTFIAAKQYDSALALIDSTITQSESIEDIYSLSSALKTKADVYLEQSDYEKAIFLYRQSEEKALNIENKSILSGVYESMARSFFALGSLVEAIQYSNKALEMATIVNDRQTIVDCYLLQSRIMEKKENYQQALLKYQAATELSNKIIDESKLHGIYNMEIQHLSKDKEIQRHEIERQQYLINKRNTTIYIVVLVALFVVVTVILVYYYYANKVKTEQQKKINEANLRSAEERAKVALEAEIQERKQLGLELHDRVGPLLSLAKLNLTAITDRAENQNGSSKKILNNTLETVNEVLKEIKQISQNMAPVVLIENGLEAAIKNLVSRLNETMNYHVVLDTYQISSNMDSYVEHVLYRSVLESVNNILHHANGTEINIQIIGSDDDITVMIEDNGQGFEPSEIEQKKGLGLKSMRNRIESLKGSMFVDSKIGKGTIVTFIVPYKTRENHAKYKSDSRIYY